MATGDLFYAILKQKFPGVQAEYRFHSERRWRFDYAWPKSYRALEIEGGVWSAGRHTRGAGYLGDMEKYNTASLLGWAVYRVTPQQVKSGEALQLLEQVFSVKLQQLSIDKKRKA